MLYETLILVVLSKPLPKIDANGTIHQSQEVNFFTKEILAGWIGPEASMKCKRYMQLTMMIIAKDKQNLKNTYAVAYCKREQL